MTRTRAALLLFTACASLAARAEASSDDCASATAVGEGVFPYDTTNATSDGPNPCASVGSRNVWFRYTASASGNTTVSTCASDFGPNDQQSVVAVYSGTCGAPVNITCSFSGCGLGSSATFAATAGQSYLIQIGGGCDDCTSDGQLTIVSDAGPPANDGCGSPRLIGEGVHPISNVGATLDGVATCAATASDVWFLYVPPMSGLAEILTCGSAFDTVLTVFDGATCASPELACSDDDCRTQSSLLVPVVGMQPYLIQVAGAAASVRGPITGVGKLAVHVLNRPVNDDCADATAVGEGAFPFTNVDSTTDGPQDCEDLTRDVWFLYTPSVTGLATITASGFDTILSVYEGGCGTLAQIGCNNDYASVAATVNVPVTAGLPLRMLVGGNGAAQGSGSLVISAAAAPGNDACGSAQAVGIGTTAFTTRGASTDGPAPTCVVPTDQIHNDVWFSFTSPGAGDVVIGTCGSLFDTLLAVYPGMCPEGDVAELVCDDDSCADGGPSVAVVHGVSAGQTLLVRVGGFDGLVGDGVLTIALQGSPCVIEPEPDSVIESEACGADTNGGCAAETPAFQDLACAPMQTIFGSAFAANGLRDTDWYRVVLPAAATITWGGRAEFPAVFSIRTGPFCQGDELARAVTRSPCEGPSTCSIRVPAGTYHLVVVPSDFWSGAECEGASEYLARLSVACEATGACCIAGACSVRTQADCAAVGGGYAGPNTACENTAYFASTCDAAFESIELTGAPGPECDGCEVRTPIGFTFSFYGRSYTEVFINANGFLSFGPVGRFTDHPHPIPRNWSPNAIIAPWWTDLLTILSGSIRSQTLGTPGARRFIVQWTQVPRGFEVDENTFQVVLNEADGSIDFRYQTVSGTFFPDQTVIGVENADGTAATTFDPTSPLANLCLHFAASSPGPVCPTCIADFNGSGSVSVQDIFDFLSAYFMQDPRADVNHVGGVTVQDIFDFLAAYFTGC
jgi:hypothetical protein